MLPAPIHRLTPSALRHLPTDALPGTDARRRARAAIRYAARTLAVGAALLTGLALAGLGSVALGTAASESTPLVLLAWLGGTAVMATLPAAVVRAIAVLRDRLE